VNMKTIITALALSISIFTSAAPQTELSVQYVYQVDNADPTAFDFAVPAIIHACGSNIYRVFSNSEAAAERKFRMVMSVFKRDKKWSLSINELDSCDANRMKVGWVQLHKR